MYTQYKQLEYTWHSLDVHSLMTLYWNSHWITTWGEFQMRKLMEALGILTSPQKLSYPFGWYTTKWDNTLPRAVNYVIGKSSSSLILECRLKHLMVMRLDNLTSKLAWHECLKWSLPYILSFNSMRESKWWSLWDESRFWCIFQRFWTHHEYVYTFIHLIRIRFIHDLPSLHFTKL